MIDNIGRPPVNVQPSNLELANPANRPASTAKTDTPAPASTQPKGAGQVNVPDASLQGTDWNTLVNQMGAMNTSVSTSAVMSMLIEVMAQMRQDARASAFDEMKTSLDLGVKAAEKMKKAATQQLVGSATSSAISLVGSAASFKMNDKATSTAKSNTSEAALREAQAISGQANAVNTAFSSVSSTANAGFNYAAEIQRADMKIDDAQAQYHEALAQQNRNFMEQLGQSISKALSTMQAVDRAQHEATGAIYGM